MKKYIAIILTLFCLSCHAEEITCFSDNGQVIYKHRIKGIKIVEDFYVFQEYGTEKIVYIQRNCVVKFNRHELKY